MRINHEKAMSLFANGLLASAHMQTLDGQLETERGALSKNLMEVAHACDNRTEWDQQAATFREWLRAPTGQTFLAKSGLKLDTVTNGKTKEVTYKLPQHFTQAVSNIGSSFELADKGLLLNDKGKAVKVKDVGTESELRQFKRDSNAKLEDQKLQAAAAQGPDATVIIKGEKVNAREEAMRRELQEHYSIIGSGIRILNGARLEALYIEIKGLAKDTSAALVEQKNEEREADRKAQEAKAQAETDANAAKGASTIPAPAEAAPASAKTA